MRTADTIAQQAEQSEPKVESLACEQALEQPKASPADRIKQWRWVKGQSGNPNGRPRDDFSAEFARKVMEAEGDEELLNEYARGYANQLRKGNAYTFKELAERGYGKLTDKVQHTGADGGPIQTAITVTFANPDASTAG